MHGKYQPRYHDDSIHELPKEPSALRAAANRALDAFSSRADAAMRKYRERKGMR